MTAIYKRALRISLPLLLAALPACRDGAGPDPQPVPAADQVAPAIQLDYPRPALRSPGQVRLGGIVTDSTAVTRATFQVDGGAETALPLNRRGMPVDLKWAQFDTLVPLPAGSHTLVVRAYDEAGNRGSTPAVQFAVDASAPQIRLATPAAVTVASDTVRVRATVTDDHDVYFVEVSLGTQAALSYFATGAPRPPVFAIDTLVTLAVGANEIDLVARDSAYNGARVKVLATRTAAPRPASFDAVAASNKHGCGLRSGAAYCWGGGTVGQLGNGRAISRDTPVPVAGGLTFSSLALGSERSCGLTPAGAVYCWGSDFYGALGRGESTGGIYPNPQRAASDVRFTALAPGTAEFTTCALAASGEAYCWGVNSRGQAGVPASTGTCMLATNPTACVVTPTRVQGGLRFASLSTGTRSTCGVAVDGRAYCWGEAFAGNASSDVPSAVPGGLLFTGISVGGLNVCGVTTTGEVYCWGSNQGGALGDATTENRTAPTRVASTVRFRSVGASRPPGAPGPGACALGEDGAVYCWGGGRLVPTRLEGGLAFTSLSANHSCGITVDRTAYCWTLTTGPVPVPGDYP